MFSPPKRGWQHTSTGWSETATRPSWFRGDKTQQVGNSRLHLLPRGKKTVLGAVTVGGNGCHLDQKNKTVPLRGPLKTGHLSRINNVLQHYFQILHVANASHHLTEPLGAKLQDDWEFLCFASVFYPLLHGQIELQRRDRSTSRSQAASVPDCVA